MELLNLWNKFNAVPGGRLVFSRLLGKKIPYTGTVYPTILELNKGHAKIQMKDRGSIRNHLKSIHAAALMNFAEVASGLAFNASLPDTHRSILKKFTIEYTKKARGILTAECHLQPFEVTDKFELVVESVVKDQDGDVVARAHAHWVGGKKK